MSDASHPGVTCTLPGTPYSTVACTFSSDAGATEALRLLTAVAAPGGIRIGAVDARRAKDIAAETGAGHDLDPKDPLLGVGDLATAADAARSVNRGALVGGLAGAVIGYFAGFTAIARFVPLQSGRPWVALVLLGFAIGVAIGGVFGGAFGRRPSTHAGFRLIDAMEEGQVAVVALVGAHRTDEAMQLLERAGAADIIAFAGRTGHA
jgi:hypothetical protein